VAAEAKSELEKTLKALLLVSLESMKQKQQITTLDKAGFGPSEIAAMIGSTSNTVNVRLSEIRKEARKNKKWRWTLMAKKVESTVLSTLQDLLIFQMASKGVPQGQIRDAVGLKMDRVSRIAKLAKKSSKSEEWDMAELSDVVKRLDAVIALLAVTLPQPDQPRSLRDQIRLLDAAGLAPAEIARIVDRPSPAVNSELARIRGKKKNGKKSRGKE
jgi:hypothetical protein